MDAVTETTGKYYPVRDSCDKDGDPAEKCVYTQALFYQSYTFISNIIFLTKEKSQINLFKHLQKINVYNKNKNMKQTIKLRESELKRMIAESAKRVLREYGNDIEDKPQ